MGCGVSKESATSDVLGNTVTQNGNSHHPNSNNKGKQANGSEKGNSNGGTGFNLNDPELDEAATRIQAAFRGHIARKEIQEKKTNKEAETNMSNQQEEEVVDIDLNDPEVGVAATKIQASFRGHKARREAEKAKAESELSEELEKLKTKEVAEEEELPDLTDPELNKAATLIQAQFKGHMVRKTKNKDEAASK